MIECVVFCEARADAQVAQRLADRILRDAAPWADGVLDALRAWRGDRHRHGDDDVWFVKWTDLKKRPTGRPHRRLRIHGRYGRTIKGEAAQARKALVWTALERPDANAVILMRDDDGQNRRPSFEAARVDAGPAVVLALPTPEVEAWSIVAFDPADDTEEEALASLRADLGAHPHAVAHRLAPKRDDLPRGTKTVLGRLTAHDPRRALRGLHALPLDTLRARGDAVGLTAFLDELSTRLAPLLTPSPRT